MTSLSTSQQNQITFTDIAANGQNGITYQRGASERNSIADQIKQQPVLEPANAPPFPVKARGAPGVAIFDYDGDNDLDIYVTNGPGVGNSLYENQLSDIGQVSFVDVAAQAGVEAIDQDSTGVSYGDIDNDGDLDLLVLGSGEPNQLFENQGDGTFIDITQQSAIGGDTTYSASASMGDINGDGLLDIVIANTFNWDNQLPLVAETFALNEPNQLLLNRGNNVFEDVSDSSGFTNISSLPAGVSTITWAVAMVDYDLDGDVDIIQADDQAVISPTSLGGVDRGYIQVFNNDGTGAFANVTEAVNLDRNGFWMGLSFGDFNHDGNLDIFGSNFGDYTSSLLPIAFDPPTSRWFLGQDDGSFVDPGVGNLGGTPFGWGTSAFDYDNDSDTDIVFHGGMDLGQVVDASNPGAILENDGNANFVYALEAGANSTDHLRRNVQGVAVGDLNSDGFVDIVSVSNFDSSEPISLVPYPINSGSELDGVASLVPVFVPGANPNELVWSGVEFTDGTLSVEINSADNHNNWITVETIGTVGLTTHGQVNRSGIGATVLFTPDGGSTAIIPILGGSSYGSQDSLTANFGLGEATTGTVDVLWQDGTRNRLYNVQAGEHIVLPEIPVSFDGVFAGPNDYQQQLDQAITELIAADVISADEGQRLFDSNVQAYMESMEPSLVLNPETQLVTVDDPSPTVVVLWDRAIQEAVIDHGKLGPTVASRAYAIAHTAIFDAWTAYNETAIGTQLGDSLQRPQAENTDTNKAEAISYAAYRSLAELFPEQIAIFDGVMAELGFDVNNLSTDATTPAGIGNLSAEAVMNFRRQDGANQLNDYADTTGYSPVNTSDNIETIDRWTAERVPIDSPNGKLQEFLTPHWGTVEGFSIDAPEAFRPPTPQPFLLVDDATVDLDARTITLVDDTVLDITPNLVGTIINPEFIAQTEEVLEYSANLTDEQKLIAEFWEDNEGTSFPPGTWMNFGQFVSARDDNSLDDDVQLFFTLSNAVFDAGITTWEAKTFYDYARPVRVVRSLGDLGLIGEFDAQLGGYAIEAWAGPEAGTRTILATEFLTYQTPGSNPSPPFSEYTSGHSSFSAAAATVLELTSGSDTFGGEITFATGESRFEPGFTPQDEVTLIWDTFSEAADEAGISRLYGGIHFTEGDLNGRVLGREVGVSVFEMAQFYINGGQEQEFLIGTGNADELVGSEANEELHGRSGDDVLAGHLGDDVLYGGDGNDVLRGDLNQRNAQGNIGGDDTLLGGAGNDRLGGKGGNDTLLGESGDDELWGDSGDDLLRGGLGNDTLTGDDASGGHQGVDTFVLAVGEGQDTITDFALGTDLLGLADGLTFGQLTFSGNDIIADNEVLATLTQVSSSSLTNADFVLI